MADIIANLFKTGIIAILLKMLVLMLLINLVARLWQACITIQELNRTVQLLAYDIKDLKDRIGAQPANQTPGQAQKQTENPTEQDQ